MNDPKTRKKLIWVAALGGADDQLGALQLHVLDPQLQRLQQSQPGAVQQAANQQGVALQLGQ